MTNTIARRLMVGASTFCFIRICAATPQAQAQTMAVDPTPGVAPISNPAKSNPEKSNPALNKALDLGLNQSTALQVSLSRQPNSDEVQRVRLSQVADSLNAQMSLERAIAAQPVGFQLSSLPIVNDLVDDSGNLDMAKGLPFSIGLGNVMGQTGIVLSTDFE